uniref:Protein p34 n=3 Tax=Magnetovibrio blakemorei TaxID=28181 RepID=C4RAA5_9PROT|nr:Cation efflux protein [Magnetovibrio blakemorei]
MMMAKLNLHAEDIARLKKNATALSLVIGAIMLSMKVGAWLATGSVSVLSALMDSILDNVMGVVNFLAVRRALQPADPAHRFGFSKFEPLASLAQSAFIIGAAIMIAFEAVDRFLHPHSIEHADWGIASMVGVIVLMVGLVAYQQKVIRLTGSLVVKADSLHYKADVMMHVGIVVSLLIASAGGVAWIDSVIALIIAAYLSWNAKEILGEAISILLDHELSDEVRHQIRNIALSHPCIHDVHDLRTRSAGDQIFIQLHVEMDPDLSLKDAHRFAEEAIDKILEVFPNAEVQVHQEPLGMPRHRSWCRKAGLHPSPGEFGEAQPNETELT